ncbi:hypothetical protein BGZ82_002618, partial [Podila clonocystis]
MESIEEQSTPKEQATPKESTLPTHSAEISEHAERSTPTDSHSPELIDLHESKEAEGSPNPKGSEKQRRPEKHKEPSELKESTEAKETKDAIRATWNGIEIMFYEYDGKWGCICTKPYATRKALRSHFFGPSGGTVPRCTMAMNELSGPGGVTESRHLSHDFYYARLEKRRRAE